MNARSVIAGLAVLLVAGGAAVALWTPMPSGNDVEAEGAAVQASAEARGPAPRTPNPGANPGYQAPDVRQPLPKRVADGLHVPSRRGDGVRMAAPAHDFEQTYEADLDSVEQGVEARAHRIRACADVFGVPNAPPTFPVEDETELDGKVAVMIEVGEGADDFGDVQLHINGAPPGLADCLVQAVGDMSVASPGEAGLTTQVLIPLDTDEEQEG